MLQVPGLGSRGYFSASKVPIPKENGEQEKNDEWAFMAVDQEPDSEITAETKLGKIDG